MKCPFCNANETKVLDSRNLKDGSSIRRRRRCEACERRFTTYETIEVNMPMVYKIDGRREEFFRDKLISSLEKACQKRPVSTNQISHIGDNIEKTLLEMNDKEVSTKAIGHLVMMYLRHLDPVAYIRFASVYLKFSDVKEFVNDISHEEHYFNAIDKSTTQVEE